MFKKYLQFINEDLSSKPARIAILGDITFERRDLIYDPFVYLRKWLNSNDFVCANLETTLSGFTSDRFVEPRFSAEDSVLDYLGFVDLFFTSNNHSLDYGIDGLLQTINTIRTRGFQQIGTFENESEDRFVTININGKKISFIAFTQFINKRENSYKRVDDIDNLDDQLKKHIMFYDEDQLNDIVKLASMNSDFVVVYSHSDTKEFENRPESEYKKFISSIKEMGVDLIIGAHPHEFQGANDSEIYSLGNFFGELKIEGRYPINYGCILTFEVIDKIQNMKYIPISTVYVLERPYVIPLSMIEKNQIIGITEEQRKSLMDKLNEIRNTFKHNNLKEEILTKED